MAAGVMCLRINSGKMDGTLWKRGGGGGGGQDVPHLSAGYNLSTAYFLTIDRFRQTNLSPRLGIA